MKLYKKMTLLVATGILFVAGCDTTGTQPDLSRVEVSMGTINGDTLGTVIFLGSSLPDGTPEIEVGVQGPNGWNNDEVYAYAQPITAGEGFVVFTDFLTDVEPVSGSYKITLKLGDSILTRSLDLDAEKTIAKARILKAAGNGFTVSTDWDEVKDAGQYRATVLRHRNEDYQVINFVNTLADTTAFDIPYANFTGAPDDEYVLELLSFSYQLAYAKHLPEQLNVSSAHALVQTPEVATDVSLGSR